MPWINHQAGQLSLRRLRFIRSAQAAGFTLQEIGELLALDATEDSARAREMARARVAELDKIVQLQTSREALRHLAEVCGAQTSGRCPILTAFDTK